MSDSRTRHSRPVDLQGIEALSASRQALLAARLGAVQTDQDSATAQELRLAAAITLTHSESADEDSLLQALALRLPRQLLPSAIHIVDEMPRLPNGKLNVQAVLDATQDQGHEAQGDTWVSPSTPTEITLAEIWKELLQVDELSIHDDFFELGGDSILSVAFVSQATQRGLSLSPNDIFNFPTIARLAAHCAPQETTATLNSQHDADTSNSDSPGDRAPAKTFVMLHGPTEVTSLLRKLIPENTPAFFASAHWESADIAHRTSVAEMAKDTLAELQAQHPNGPYVICGYSMGALIALEVAQQLKDLGAQVERLCLIDPPSSNHGKTDTHDSSAKGLSKALATLDRLLINNPAVFLRKTKGYLLARFFAPLQMAYYRVQGDQAPKHLRDRYVSGIYLSAWRRYALRPYDGQVVLFRAAAGRHAPTTEWDRLAPGNLMCEWVEGDHHDFYRSSSLREQWIQRLVELLQE